jgi:hypothetical protein
VEKPAPLFVIDSPALSKTAECLNSAFAADPNAIHALIVNRVPCNQALVDHPQIYVDMLTVVDSSLAQATLLGVLNGVLVANGLPRVATKWSTEADEEGRRKLLGFCDYPEDVVKTEESQTLHSCTSEAAVRAIDAKCMQFVSDSIKRVPSIEELWEIYSHLQLLRSEEASQVTFTCANPEPEDSHEEVVEVKDLWTEWCGKDFRGATLLECLRKAVEARKAWYAEQEAKKIKLPWKT